MTTELCTNLYKNIGKKHTQQRHGVCLFLCVCVFTIYLKWDLSLSTLGNIGNFVSILFIWETF